MTGIIRNTVYFTLFAFVLGEFASRCEAEETLEVRERLMSEAPQKWEEYHTRGKHLQGSWLKRMILSKNGEKKSSVTVRFEVKQSTVGASHSMRVLEGYKKATEDLLVVNSRYGFKLRRLEPEDPWLIAGMNLNLEDFYKSTSVPPDLSASAMTDGSFCFSTSFSIVLILPYLIKEPEFSVRKVTLLQQDRKDLVRLEFSNQPHMVSGKHYKQFALPDIWNDLAGGWVLLDPAHYWVFREYHIDHKWYDESKGVTEAQFEYKMGENDFPILSRIKTQYNGISKEGENIDHKVTLDLDLVELDNLSESDFTLSAYGFPEPPGLERKVPLFVWLALAGLLCLVGTIVYRRRIRRGGNLAKGVVAG